MQTRLRIGILTFVHFHAINLLRNVQTLCVVHTQTKEEEEYEFVPQTPVTPKPEHSHPLRISHFFRAHIFGFLQEESEKEHESMTSERCQFEARC